MGSACLLDRWGELRDLLAAGDQWQPPDRFKRSACWAVAAGHWDAEDA